MYKGFCTTKIPHQRGSSTMSIDVSMPRGQRRRMQKVLRKTKSRIEALPSLPTYLRHLHPLELQ